MRQIYPMKFWCVITETAFFWLAGWLLEFNMLQKHQQQQQRSSPKCKHGNATWNENKTVLLLVFVVVILLF